MRFSKAKARSINALRCLRHRKAHGKGAEARESAPYRHLPPVRVLWVIEGAVRANAQPHPSAVPLST